MYSEKLIGGKRCFLYENSGAEHLLIQAVDEHDLEVLDREVELVRELAPGIPFLFAAFLLEDWNSELSPWEAPAVFGREDFGGGARDTLAFITDVLLPVISRDEQTDVYLGGYSLAGLFALWAGYQTDVFRGVAAVSPSVWFPGWEAYAATHPFLTSGVYLSLGDKEEKIRNKTMARVGDNIRLQYELLQKEPAVKACTLEWNPGNHFADSELRTAKGFAWLLDRG